MAQLLYSRRTVLAALDILERRLTQAQFSRFVLALGPQFSQSIATETLSLTKRLNTLMALLDERPDTATFDGDLVCHRVVEKAAGFMPNLQYSSDWEKPNLDEIESKFARDLGGDGFTIADNSLRRMMPTVLQLPESESELVQLLKKHGFTVAHGHLDNAFGAHTRGEWAGANGQLRTFVEAFFDEIAVRLDPSSATLRPGMERRSKLANLGFFSRDLNEWDDKGLGFINGLIKRLHPDGAHPGLSDEEDSTFRLHTVLLLARLLLARFDRRVQGQG